MSITNQPRYGARALEPLELTAPPPQSARDAMVQRLCDIVAWPESLTPPHERHLAADVLMGLIRNCGVDLRRRCAQGLAPIHNAPKALLLYLARDEIQVASPLLEAGLGFDDSDLIVAVRAGIAAHWLAIARRRSLSETVTDALLLAGDGAVMEAVLRNPGARLSTRGIDLAVTRARQVASLPGLLVSRAELRPTQALVLFWCAGFDARLHILRRFGVDRNVLIAELGEVFALAAKQGWSDAEARRTMAVIERRQRNRAAAAQSAYGSLEGAMAAAEHGLDDALLNEIAHLSGVKPATAKRIFADPGGEAIGVFCKATGLKRPAMIGFWRALGRLPGDPDSVDNPFGRTCYVFDMLATAKAQTALRYWNWSFTPEIDQLEYANFEHEDNELPLALRNVTGLIHPDG